MVVERLLTVGRLEQQQQSQRLHHGARLSPSPSVQPSYSLAEPPPRPPLSASTSDCSREERRVPQVPDRLRLS